MLDILLVTAALACAPTVGLGMRTFSIPSASMEPGLPLGSMVGVYRCAYGLSRYTYDGFELPFAGRWPDVLPQRGDVIVFRLPRDHSTFFVKRVIGLPGDEVQLAHGRLILNGATVDREPLPPVKMKDLSGVDKAAAAFLEKLPGGRAYPIVEVEGDDGLYENTSTYRVPPGSVFVLGDNRDNSLDSRMAAKDQGVGFVPAELVIGQVVTVGPMPAWTRVEK